VFPHAAGNAIRMHAQGKRLDADLMSRGTDAIVRPFSSTTPQIALAGGGPAVRSGAPSSFADRRQKARPRSTRSRVYGQVPEHIGVSFITALAVFQETAEVRRVRCSTWCEQRRCSPTGDGRFLERSVIAPEHARRAGRKAGGNTCSELHAADIGTSCASCTGGTGVAFMCGPGTSVAVNSTACAQ